MNLQQKFSDTTTFSMTTFPSVNSRRALGKDNFSILSMIKIPFTIEDFYNPGCSFIGSESAGWVVLRDSCPGFWLCTSPIIVQFNHQYPLLVIIIRAIIMIVIIIIEIVI